ncbi:MAG: ATP-binding cassette domain-containing protein [Saprospiraceae bacterium]|nr:ATP-binding cassette domain-containing protein [Saprospiraceae bacterium]
MIQINQLYKSFGTNQVLKGIDLNLDKPGITAILGPNGSGKTTLIKSILGMVLPDQGHILFDGKPIHKKWAYRETIGYLPQIVRFPENLKPAEMFALIKNLRGQNPDLQHLINRFELEPFLQKRLGNLSGGTRQKINLVQAFGFDSKVLILDEPTAGLDPVSVIELKKLLEEERKKGKIILLTTHIISFVEEMAEQMVFLLDGHIHFKGDQKTLKSTFGDDRLERAIANILRKDAINQSEPEKII